MAKNTSGEGRRPGGSAPIPRVGHALVALLVLSGGTAAADTAPLFQNSVVSNDIDFIRPDDPSALQDVTYIGQSRQEMPSVLRDDLFLDGTLVYTARYTDGTALPIWLDPAIGTADQLAQLAQTVAHRVGQLPPIMRGPLQHVVVNSGDAAATEEADGGFFILYAGNITTRIAQHDLSETVFHEAAHVALQNDWLHTDDWRRAVSADPGHITAYARTSPAEDFAETALFAYTYHRWPERLPADVRAAMDVLIPNRTTLFHVIIPD